MSRTLSPPSFPDSPGKWLSWYRYRAELEGSSSPEQIGRSLGVSGATVRRWEAGYSSPTGEDIRRLAEVCELGPLETDFLIKAFGSEQFESPPSEKGFDSAVESLLRGTTNPAVLLDSLGYIRAWNDPLVVLKPAKGPMPRHYLVPSILGQVPTNSEPLRLQALLREFWQVTARLCGSPGYVRFLNELRPLGEFEAYWQRLALEKDDDAAKIRKAP